MTDIPRSPYVQAAFQPYQMPKQIGRKEIRAFSLRPCKLP